MRHLRNLWDLDGESIVRIVESGAAIKRSFGQVTRSRCSVERCSVSCLKPSLRTRTSFEVGMFRLGGQAVALKHYEVGLVARASRRCGGVFFVC